MNLGFSVALQPGYDVVDVVDGGGEGVTRREAVGGADDNAAGVGGKVGAEAVVGFGVAADEGAAVDVKVKGAEAVGQVGVWWVVDDGVVEAAAGGDADEGESVGEEEGKGVDGVGEDGERLKEEETPAGD